MPKIIGRLCKSSFTNLINLFKKSLTKENLCILCIILYIIYYRCFFFFPSAHKLYIKLCSLHTSTFNASNPACMAGARIVSVSRVSANICGICAIRLSITVSLSSTSHKNPSKSGINTS